MTEKRKAYIRDYSKVRALYAHSYDWNERRMLEQAHPTWKLDNEFKTRKSVNAKNYRSGLTYKLYVEKNQEKLKLAYDKFQATKKAKVYRHEWYLKNKKRLKPMWAEKSRIHRAKDPEAYRIHDREYRREYRRQMAL